MKSTEARMKGMAQVATQNKPRSTPASAVGDQHYTIARQVDKRTLLANSFIQRMTVYFVSHCDVEIYDAHNTECELCKIR